jgi:hypothetical protein
MFDRRRSGSNIRPSAVKKDMNSPIVFSPVTICWPPNQRTAMNPAAASRSMVAGFAANPACARIEGRRKDFSSPSNRASSDRSSRFSLIVWMP